MNNINKSKIREEKAKQRAAQVGGFSLVAAKKLRQCLEKAKRGRVYE